MTDLPQLLTEEQRVAIGLKAQGRTNASIGRFIGLSHTMIGRWFKPGHFVAECYNRFIETGELYAWPPQPKPIYSSPEEEAAAERIADINEKISSAFSEWWKKRERELGDEFGPVPYHERKKRKALYRRIVRIILSESDSWFRDFIKSFPEMTREEKAEYFQKMLRE